SKVQIEGLRRRGQGRKGVAEHLLNPRVVHRGWRSRWSVGDYLGRLPFADEIDGRRRSGDGDGGVAWRAGLRVRQKRDEFPLPWRRCHPTRTARQRGRNDRQRDRERPRHGVTPIARRVPRTPTTADGVSRRIESGESLAIRPDT